MPRENKTLRETVRVEVKSNRASIETTLIWLEHNGYDIDKMNSVDVEEATCRYGEWLFNLHNPKRLEHVHFWIDTALNGEVTAYE